ncbi:MAG: LD-carboxypeptidase [Comamonadaceae bacterium CG1_02_60_18]|nr:MAG: LD-carboxypeptidase [Comamonadaceae bacterium CG1_02_60_18]PIQ53906.1 MAG: LD-carboxypeptidase [Comamonadaceae bacterium CG12_big_fil_rev_8_21_14_0_65_59_15]
MKKHIYIYSPSGAVRDKAAFRRGIRRLTALGHEVEVDPDALTSFQRFAGDDAVRLAAIARAADSGADVALMSRGGYGLTRLLPDINYRKVARAIARGTAFVGISDFTAFQNAILAKTGAVTWAGPALCEGFGVGGAHNKGTEPDDIMTACFDDLLSGRGEGTGWRLPRTAEQGNAHVGNATLWGGNLTVLTSLLGTPYFPAVQGGVLFLEDVAEHPYRIERMLTQLLLSGVLARQKAVLLGQFTEFKLTSHDKGFNLAQVVQWLRSHLKIPVLTHLPFGHVQTKVLLPVGAKVDLVSNERDVLMLWGHR